MRGHVHDFVAKREEDGSGERLGEEVREVLRGGDEGHTDAVLHLIVFVTTSVTYATWRVLAIAAKMAMRTTAL